MNKFMYVLFAAMTFVACEKSNVELGTVSPSDLLTDEQIREKVANYYSAPSTRATPADPVKAAFYRQFPDARDVEWEYSNDVYEVEFEIGRVDHEALYDAEALLIMYKYDVRTADLPAAVQNAVAADYPGYRIDDAEKVFKGTTIGYSIEIEMGKSEIDVYYLEDGTFVANSLCECNQKPENSINQPSVPVDNGNAAGSYTTEQILNTLAQYFSVRSTDTTPLAAVAESFAAQFTGARDIEWETAADVYSVDFEITNVDYQAWYHRDGARLAYAYDIRRTALPQAVADAATAQYPGYRIDDTERMYIGQTPAYSIELEKGDSEVDALFADDGNRLAEYKYR
jgi:hypothetical protein